MSVLDAAAGVAAADGHDMDRAQVEALLGRLAEDARYIAELPDWRQRAEALAAFLNQRLAFHGNQADYYQIENSYLDLVLDRGVGIPISLGLIYLAVGERIGVAVRGVNFPGHFLVAVTDPDAQLSSVLIDPFNGRVLSLADCTSRLKLLHGSDAELHPDHLRIASVQDIALRMLSNLKHIRLQRKEMDRVLALCNASLQLDPDNITELRDRAVVLEQLDCFDAALDDWLRLRDLIPDETVRAAIDRRIETVKAKSQQQDTRH